MRNEKLAEFQSLVREFLTDGERILVEANSENILVVPLNDGAIQQISQRLHGQLIACEAQLTGDTGSRFWLWVGGIILVIGLIVSNPSPATLDLSAFQSWWIYLGIAVGGMGTMVYKTSKDAARLYPTIRAGMLEAIRQSGMDPFQVVSLTQKSNELNNVRQQLMNDLSLLPGATQRNSN